MFIARITSEDGTLINIAEGTTATEAIVTATTDTEAHTNDRVRIEVSENYSEIFWAWGIGIEDAKREAIRMDRKSKRCVDQ